jgi:hypothetical protein
VPPANVLEQALRDLFYQVQDVLEAVGAAAIISSPKPHDPTTFVRICWADVYSDEEQ